MSSITSVGQAALYEIMADKPKKSSVCKRVTDILVRFLKSNTLKALVLSAAVAGTVTILAFSHTVVVAAIAGIIGGVALLILGIHVIINRKKIIYEVSLFATLLIKKFRPQSYSWWHLVAPNLYLGALPLKNLKHDEKIAQLGVRAVVSLVENFEFKTKGPMSVPCLAKDWERLGVQHLFLPAVDFKPVPLDVIEKGVEILEEKIDQGVSCYVHCKAGRSRSASLVLAYLLKKKIVPTLDDGILYLKQKRPIVSIQKGKRQILEQFFQKHCA